MIVVFIKTECPRHPGCYCPTYLNGAPAAATVQEGIQAEASVGATAISVQTRCTQWHVHEPPLSRPHPCEGCYSLVVTSVRVPYRDPRPWWGV